MYSLTAPRNSLRIAKLRFTTPLLQLLLLTVALSSPLALSAMEDGVPLEVWGINNGILDGSKTWKFRQSVAGNDLQTANVADPSFDDRDWQTVDLRWRTFPGPGVANHFRKEFTLDEIGVELAQITGIQVSIQYDDTSVLYLNGVEVYRSIRGNLDPTFATYPLSSNIPHDANVAFGGFENFYVDIPNINGTNTCERRPACDRNPITGPNPPAIPVSLLRDGTNVWSVTTWNQSGGGSGDSSLNHTFTLLIDDTLMTAAPIYINEVMASNDTTLGFELNGSTEYPDWIELYNESDAPVNLQDWQISDASASWTFPNISIPAFGYLVIAANDEDRNDTSPLQTNFKLSVEGDSLRLVDPNGFLADEYSVIPIQSADNSYGRPNNDTAQPINYLSTPTPGAINSPASSGSSPNLRLFTDKIYNLGDLVSEQVDAFDPDGDAITYDLSPKPPGIDIDNDGQLTGTVSTAGTFDSTISITDINRNITSQAVRFTVLPAPATPPSLILNEYNAVSSSKELKDGSAVGNGGNWFEFIVVEDQLDLSGMSVALYDNQGSDDQLRLAAELTFVNDNRLSALPAGLIVTISDEMSDDLSFDKLNDWHINFQVDSDANGAFFVPTNGDFDSTHEGQAVLIRNATGEVVSPLSGETSAWDEANGGVSSEEAMTLCINPTAGFTLDPIQNYADNGTTSSFGAENTCPASNDSTFTQNLTALRSGTQNFEITSTIASGEDDAEERASGNVFLRSSDLELIEDKGSQTVGLRFTNLAVPANAVIENAYIQFQADERHTGNTLLTIAAESSSDAAPFTSRRNNVSSRNLTSSTVAWSPAPWQTIGQQSAEQQTPDLSVIVQSIVDLSTWNNGQSIAFIITGSGERTAVSYEGDSSAAPSLHIEYSTDNADDGGGNEDLPPVARVQASSVTGSSPLTVSFTTSGSTDDGSIVRYDWDFGNGNSRRDAGGSISHIYDTVGSFVARVTITDDSGQSSSANITITTTEPDQLPPFAESAVFLIAKGENDAEERASGNVFLGSSDLELSEDRNAPQTIGLRFTDIDIPRGAVIQSATIQFTTDESSSGNSDLEIAVQTSDNAPVFGTNFRNISNRITGESVNWSPENWIDAGVRGEAQRTPELSKLVQLIVDRNNWTSGNAIAFIITGTGKRTAESYNGDSNSAAALNIEYSLDRNQPPVARLFATPTTGDFPLTVTFDASASTADTQIASYDWGFGDGQFLIDGPTNPSITYFVAGTYTADVLVTDDSGNSSDASVEILVTDPIPPVQRETAVFTISSGADDVEQQENLRIATSSSDLELTEDNGVQTIGLRFTGVTLPRGALIHEAHIQFTADETQSGQANILIAAQTSGDAVEFTRMAGELTSRVVGNAVEWAPLPWNIVNERSAAQRTPNLKDNLQEIVDRADWENGNAIAFIITGSGKRTAESYEGSSDNAAALVIEYSISQ